MARLTHPALILAVLLVAGCYQIPIEVPMAPAASPSATAIDDARATLAQATPAGPTAQPPIVDAALEGTSWEWMSTRFNNGDLESVADPTRYALSFGPEDKVLVNADCNTGMGTYRQTEAALALGLFELTTAMCAGDSKDSRFLQQLGIVGEARLEGATLFLVLRDDAGIMAFRRADGAARAGTAPAPLPGGPLTLQGTAWKWLQTELPAGAGAQVSDPVRYTLEFLSDSTVSVLADCNRGSGAYSRNGDRLTLGPLAATRMVCPEGSLGVEFLGQLSTVTAAAAADGSLRLALADGRTMVFEPSSEARPLAGREPPTALPAGPPQSDTPTPAAANSTPPPATSAPTRSIQEQFTPTMLPAPTVAPSTPVRIPVPSATPAPAGMAKATATGSAPIAIGTTPAPLPSTAPAPEELAGSTWRLVQYGPPGAQRKPLSYTEVTVAFTDGMVSGDAGCNTFAGTYDEAGGALSIGPLAGTKKACQPPVMAQEAAVTGALARAGSYRMEGGRLVLSTEGGPEELVFLPRRPVTLPGSRWLLTGIIDGDALSIPEAGVPVSLAFDASGTAITGQTGCGDYAAQVAVTGNRVKVSPALVTATACAGSAKTQEERFLRLLVAADSVVASAEELAITALGDQTLTFRPQ
jgi:heat shock protein HslJ